MTAILQPEYFKQFVCIGSACEDTCCAGWSISIDRQTKAKYKKVPASIIDIKVGMAGDSFKRQAGKCHFLNEDKLCRIQLVLGESYLSETCATYPREYKRVGDVVEAAATVSCPEVARLALLNRDGISFDLDELPPPNAPIRPMTKLGSDFHEIRTLVIGTIQNRRYSLDNRLIILALYFAGIEQYRGSENDFLEGDYTEILAEIQPDHAAQYRNVKGIYDMLQDESKENQRYKECYSVSAGYLVDAEKYREAYVHYYTPYMSEHDYILENYLVNYAFRVGDFSCSIQEFHLMIVYYAMLKYMLIGLAGASGGLDESAVIKAIQSFAKRYEHHPATKGIAAFMKQNGFAELQDFIMLLKT